MVFDRHDGIVRGGYPDQDAGADCISLGDDDLQDGVDLIFDTHEGDGFRAAHIFRIGVEIDFAQNGAASGMDYGDSRHAFQGHVSLILVNEQQIVDGVLFEVQIVLENRIETLRRKDSHAIRALHAQQEDPPPKNPQVRIAPDASYIECCRV